ncbi:hypothetical protein OHA37_18385 [Streptomyces sp. NBC_00335]|uniref:hypothetical protein n=1 Tax=unclassified Streptomyces TaxID=2593676 RepID=UPI00224FB845|nr:MULTISPECIES: hypothetical protein [unclassified Streptomyces]MCX5405850.1 hypothetical protein [Streptomyces sp. NBC_00086]
MKKRILALLCTATAVGAVLAGPTAAHAADPYRLLKAEMEYERVVLDFGAPEQPDGLKVHVRKKGTTERVATVASFSSRDRCSFECGIGEVTSRSFLTDPLVLPELGEYTVDVEYDGTEGETVLHQDEAAVNYRLRPVFEDLKISNGVSLTQPNTVISGDIKIHDPRDNSQKAIAGGTITPRFGALTTPFKADAQGHFQYKAAFTGGEEVHTSWAELEYGFTYASIDFTTTLNGVKEQDYVRVPVTSTQARIALASSKATGAYATRGKVSGTVTWQASDGTWKPAPAGTWVFGGAWSSSSNSNTTDSAGRFTVSPTFLNDGTWPIETSSNWLHAPDRYVTVDTTAGTYFKYPWASVDQNKTVNVKADFERVQIPAGITSLKVEIQHSADGKTGWTTRKSVNVPTKPGANQPATVDATLPYPGAGYFRLRYAGTTAIHGWTTPAMKVARTMTAVPEFNAAPEPVKKGKPITLTGKLTHSDPAWKPFAGQTVHYYFRPTGSTTWKVMGNSKTAADGTFNKAFTADRTGSWTARYEQTDATHFYAASRVDEVVVTP